MDGGGEKNKRKQSRRILYHRSRKMALKWDAGGDKDVEQPREFTLFIVVNGSQRVTCSMLETSLLSQSHMIPCS